MLSQVIAAMLAVDGGTFTQEPYASCPVANDMAVPLDGGAWLLPPARAARTACLLATCEKMGEPPPATPGGYVVAAGIGFGLGVIAGAVAVAFLRR